MELLPPTTQPWERQPDEKSNAYRAFELYRDMGAGRSLAKVGKQLGISRQAVEKMSVRHRWVPRTVAFDNWQSRTVHAAVLSDLVKQARLLQHAAHRTLDRLDLGQENGLTVPELCLVLRTVVALAECAGNGGGPGFAGKNEFGFPSDLPQPKVRWLNCVKYPAVDIESCYLYRIESPEDGEPIAFGEVSKDEAIWRKLMEVFPTAFIVK